MSAPLSPLQGASFAARAQERAAEAHAGRVRTHAHAHARASIPPALEQKLRKLPKKSRNRIRTKWDQAAKLLAAGQGSRAALKISQLVVGELCKLARYDAEEASRLFTRVCSEFLSLATEVAGVTAGILRTRGVDEDDD